MQKPAPSRLTPFQYDSKRIRTFTHDGTAWFVAADVCPILGYLRPSAAAKVLDKDDRAKKPLGPRGSIWFISESELYSLIDSSDGPEAKPFHRWVTNEVLPAMRSGPSPSSKQANQNKETGAQRFALRLSSDFMAPRYLEGDLIVVDPGVKPKDGEPVVAYALRGYFFGIYRVQRGGWFRIEVPDRRYTGIRFEAKDLAGKVVELIPDISWLPKTEAMA